MPLMTDTLTRILLEVVNGTTVDDTDTAEEAERRAVYAQEVAAIQAAGAVVDIPADLP